MQVFLKLIVFVVGDVNINRICCHDLLMCPRRLSSSIFWISIELEENKFHPIIEKTFFNHDLLADSFLLYPHVLLGSLLVS